jgi:hypothetical protein
MQTSIGYRKILGNAPQRKLIRGCCSERVLFWICPLTQKFSAIPAAIFALPIDIEKLINVEGLILVKLPRERFRIKRVAALFRCLSFITEFVEVSFDAASGFSVLKNVRRRLSDFSGIFLGPGRVVRLVFACFWGPGARGGSFGVTNPKRDILVAV